MGSDVTKNRILEVAGPIFARKGFNNTTIREICAEANVNQAAINYYFNSKENLYREIFRSLAPMDTSILPEDAGYTFEDRIRHFVRFRAKIMLADVNSAQWEIQLVLREINDPTPGLNNVLKELIMKDFERIRAMITNQLKLDEYADDFSWKLTFSLFGQLAYYKMANHFLRGLFSNDFWNEHFTTEQIADFISGFFLQGVDKMRKDK